MWQRSRFLGAMLAIAATCAAQSVCSGGSSSFVETRDGVTVKTVSFPTPYQSLTAHVFLPDTSVAVPGIVFPYSRIAGQTAQINMLLWARALARTGAASIVLDGTLDPALVDAEARRPGEEMACASQWLLANVNLDRNRLAFGGPTSWGGGKTPLCNGPEDDPCFYPTLALEAFPAYDIFKKMSSKFPLQEASFIRRHFHTEELKPEWLEGMIVPDAP